MKPVLGSVITAAVLAVLANVALFGGLVAPAGAQDTLLVVAGVLIGATFAAGAAGALARRRSVRTHPTFRLVAPNSPAPAVPRRGESVVHAN